MITKSQFETNVNNADFNNLVVINQGAENAGLIPVSDEFGSGITTQAEDDCKEYLDGTGFGDLLDSNDNLISAKVGKKTPC